MALSSPCSLCRRAATPLAAALAALFLSSSVVAAAVEPKDAVHDEVEVQWRPPVRRLGGGPARNASWPESFPVAFEADGTAFELRLRKNRVLLPKGASHTLRYRDGRTEAGPMPKNCFYIGEVAGDPNGSAGISACGGGLSGLVLAHGRAIALEPSDVAGASSAAHGAGMWATPGSARHKAHRIRDKDLLARQAEVARFVRGPVGGKARGDKGDRRLQGAAKKYVEVFVFNDYRRYQGFGTTQQDLTNLAAHTVSVINAASAIYKNPPADAAAFPYEVLVILVGQQTFLEEDPWEDAVTNVGAETDPDSLLTLFHQWAQVQLDAGQGIEYDDRVLLSGRDFQGDTVGLAGLSTMCWKARSGNVNMCPAGSEAVAACAAVVAHEMGHNFGMHHDSDGNDCSQSGKIMEALGTGTPSDQFSSCSANYITSFFSETYAQNGECLENPPTRVEGDPICGNGFVEDGEDCDCGAADCTVKDPCCDGSTCQLADPSYECSSATGACCESCMVVAAAAKKVCREVRGTCDLPEYCTGDDVTCPPDTFMYPGRECEVQGYAGLCSGGRCQSLDATCAVDATRDFPGQWDLTPKCAAYNNDCGELVCHNAESTSPYDCGQAFVTHNKQLMVPDGSPCWFPGSRMGTKVGMCSSGMCKLPHALAEVPLCGNGGIDFGEQCDCGAATTDPCCDCATCTLKAGKNCSSQEPCCDSTCHYAAKGTVCRAAAGACDVAETCSGSSGLCPSDAGKPWGTACTAADGNLSTCYGKTCLTSIRQQCIDSTGGARPYDYRDFDGKTPGADHICSAIACCTGFKILKGTYSIDGKVVTDPYQYQGCQTENVSQTVKLGNSSNTIFINAILDGTQMNNPKQMCRDAQLVTPPTSCPSGTYLEQSVGLCLECDSACYECKGPSNFDCVGSCRFARDQRTGCAISDTQVQFTTGTWFYPTPPPPTEPPTEPPPTTPDVANTTASLPERSAQQQTTTTAAGSSSDSSALMKNQAFGRSSLSVLHALMMVLAAANGAADTRR